MTEPSHLFVCFDLLTVAEYAMQLVLRQKCKPVDAILLVLAQFGINLHRYMVLLHFVSIKKLCQELSFMFTFLQELF